MHTNESHSDNMTPVDYIASHLDDVVVPFVATSTFLMYIVKSDSKLLWFGTFSAVSLLAYLAVFLGNFILNYLAKKIMDVVWVWMVNVSNRLWYRFQLWLRNRK